MAAVAAPPPLEFEPTQVRPIKRSDYERMIEIGLFESERIELLRGVLVRMSPPLAAVADDSEPEPDAAVVAPGDYDAEHPRTALLVIEVAESTLRKDRAKAALYAAAGVAEYWIVNLVARTLEVYTRPDGARYAEARTLREGDTARPDALPGDGIAVDDILPKP